MFTSSHYRASAFERQGTFIDAQRAVWTSCSFDYMVCITLGPTHQARKWKSFVFFLFIVTRLSFASKTIRQPFHLANATFSTVSLSIRCWIHNTVYISCLIRSVTLIRFADKSFRIENQCSTADCNGCGLFKNKTNMFVILFMRIFHTVQWLVQSWTCVR